MRLRRVFLDRLPTSARRWLRNLKSEVQLVRSLAGDWRHFRNHSGLLFREDKSVVQGHILKTYHRIEKGLALPFPRPGFGAEPAAELLKYLQVYLAHWGPDAITRAALNTLRCLIEFNARHGVAMDAVSTGTQRLLSQQGPAAEHSHGGTVAVDRARDIPDGFDFEAFAAARHSVRQFRPGEVPQSAIESAVRCAIRAPSVCNRQAGLVYVVRDAQMKQRMLSFQNGNRGFGDQADVVLLVGTRLPMFHTPGERFQAWVDGGLFAMSLLHGLHAQGLGACCLNWSVTREHDRRFKVACNVPANVEVIMMIAVGLLPDTFAVAASPRRALSDVLLDLPVSPPGEAGLMQ